jgi:hypothetical protein
MTTLHQTESIVKRTLADVDLAGIAEALRRGYRGEPDVEIEPGDGGAAREYPAVMPQDRQVHFLPSDWVPEERDEAIVQGPAGADEEWWAAITRDLPTAGDLALAEAEHAAFLAGFDDVPDAEWDRLAAERFDADRP